MILALSFVSKDELSNKNIYDVEESLLSNNLRSMLRKLLTSVISFHTFLYFIPKLLNSFIENSSFSV